MFGNTKDDDDYIEGEAWGGSYHFTNKQLRENPRYRHFIAIIVKMALVWKVLKIVYRRWWWEPFKQMKGISLDKIRENYLMFFSVYNRLVIDKPFTTVSQLLLVVIDPNVESETGLFICWAPRRQFDPVPTYKSYHHHCHHRCTEMQG